MKRYTLEEKQNIVEKVDGLRKNGTSIKIAVAQAGVAVDSYIAWKKKLKKMSTSSNVIIHDTLGATKRQYTRKTTTTGQVFVIMTTPNNLKQVIASLQ